MNTVRVGDNCRSCRKRNSSGDHACLGVLGGPGIHPVKILGGEVRRHGDLWIKRIAAVRQHGFCRKTGPAGNRLGEFGRRHGYVKAVFPPCGIGGSGYANAVILNDPDIDGLARMFKDRRDGHLPLFKGDVGVIQHEHLYFIGIFPAVGEDFLDIGFRHFRRLQLTPR